MGSPGHFKAYHHISLNCGSLVPEWKGRVCVLTAERTEWLSGGKVFWGQFITSASKQGTCKSSFGALDGTGWSIPWGLTAKLWLQVRKEVGITEENKLHFKCTCPWWIFWAHTYRLRRGFSAHPSFCGTTALSNTNSSMFSSSLPLCLRTDKEESLSPLPVLPTTAVVLLGTFGEFIYHLIISLPCCLS